MDPTIIRQVPEEYRQIYKRNWNTIKQSIKKGALKDVYHYLLVSTNNSQIVTKLQETLANYTSTIKINIAFFWLPYYF